MPSAKWVYFWKVNESGRAARATDRLVARGFGQRAGVDCFETFTPCPAVACIRLKSAIACELGLHLCHFEADQAFVRSELSEHVYMFLPKGCGAMSGERVAVCMV